MTSAEERGKRQNWDRHSW